MSILKFGYISFGGYKLYASPEDYTLTFSGTRSQPIPTSTGVILDVGYGYEGFQVSGYVVNNNGATLESMHNYAKLKLKGSNPSPIVVTDTIYPGGKSWSGFFELPMIKTGTVNASSFFGLPSSYMMDKTSLTFYSTKIERF